MDWIMTIAQATGGGAFGQVIADDVEVGGRLDERIPEPSAMPLHWTQRQCERVPAPAGDDSSFVR
ncbi:MAG: hypothetical protein HYZ72_08370 [Deltaproteobacteria bacterium]|nr:hypothetical protein [Deltaproteobacteria bacterium]